MSTQSNKPPSQIKKILVSTDGSENAKRAVNAATNLAKQFAAELFIVTVLDMGVTRIYTPISPFPSDADYSHFFQRAQADGKKIIDEAVSTAKQSSINVSGKVLETMDSVPKVILDTAEKEKADLIVVGTRGLGGFKKLVLGSVSSAIVAHAHCSVLVER
ncbi:MAG: universal stress protein [Nitrososphaerales archaeon]